MGSLVLLYLEKALPEVQKLIQLEIYSDLEAKALLKKRENFEYSVRSHAKRPIDFIHYIEFEVDTYIDKKIRLIKRYPKETNWEWDLGLRHAINVWERLIKAWPQDANLWIKYVKFCQLSRSYFKLSDVVSRFLKRHPTTPAAWKLAARVEYKQRADPAAARNIFFKGMQFCSRQVEFWSAFLKFEFDYLNFSFHLKDNDMALETVKTKLPKVDAIEIDEMGNNEEEFLSFTVDKSNLPTEGPFWSGALVKLVFDKALENLKDHTQFQRDAFLLCRERQAKQVLNRKMRFICDQLEHYFANQLSEIPQPANVFNESDLQQLCKQAQTPEDYFNLGKAQCEIFEKNQSQIWEIICGQLKDIQDFFSKFVSQLSAWRIYFLPKMVHNFRSLDQIYQILTMKFVKITFAEYEFLIQQAKQYSAPSPWMINVYQKATQNHPQHPEIWADYCLYLMKQKEIEKSGLLYHQAVSKLDQPSEFMRLYQIGLTHLN